MQNHFYQYYPLTLPGYQYARLQQLMFFDLNLIGSSNATLPQP